MFLIRVIQKHIGIATVEFVVSGPQIRFSVSVLSLCPYEVSRTTARLPCISLRNLMGRRQRPRAGFAVSKSLGQMFVEEIKFAEGLQESGTKGGGSDRW